MGDRPTEPVQSAALGQCRAPLPTLTVWISHSLVRGYIGGRQFPLTVALVKPQTTGRASHLSDPRFRPSAHFACWERGATTGERRQNRRVSARQARPRRPTAPPHCRSGRAPTLTASSPGPRSCSGTEVSAQFIPIFRRTRVCHFTPTFADTLSGNPSCCGTGGLNPWWPTVNACRRWTGSGDH